MFICKKKHMLFFSKKAKPTLEAIIPKGFCDIHAHWLPGIDDGAADVEASLTLLEQLQGFGFQGFTATPHIFQHVWDNNNSTIERAYQKLVQSHPQWKTNALRIAAEYMLDETVVQAAYDKKLMCIHDRFVLIEFSYMDAPMHWEHLIFELQLAGYTPILAHPERYLYWRRQLELFSKLKDKGCLLQLNLLSVTGYYGPEVMDTANSLLQKGWIDCVGSDVHHQRHLDGFKKTLGIKAVEALENACQHPLNRIEHFIKKG